MIDRRTEQRFIDKLALRILAHDSFIGFRRCAVAFVAFLRDCRIEQRFVRIRDARILADQFDKQRRGFGMAFLRKRCSAF